MVIQSSNALMGAKSSRRTSYREDSETLMRNRSTGEMRYSGNTFQMACEDSMESKQYQRNGMPENQKALGGREEKPNKWSDWNPMRMGETRVGSIMDRRDSVRNFIRQLREYMLDMHNQLLEQLGIRGSGRSEVFLPWGDGYAMNLSSGMSTVNVWDRVQQTTCTYEETEEMSFETTGQVVTADGRTLDFNLQLSMSRQYVEQMETRCQDQVLSIMTDPLVISLDSNPVSVSDQKWKFDIDGDGAQDSISMLSKGSGFLAFDRNGDGVINDGTELFGSRTGNGFQELSKYDEDGNGWIDEADSVYDKLSVWVKDDTGEDKLMSLKDAGVGAIYLANMDTEFALKSLEDNQHNAQVRKSGVYLTEDGAAKTIQQLDMVKALIS